jgi:hypothetical protein
MPYRNWNGYFKKRADPRPKVKAQVTKPTQVELERLETYKKKQELQNRKTAEADAARKVHLTNSC